MSIKFFGLVILLAVPNVVSVTGYSCGWGLYEACWDYDNNEPFPWGFDGKYI